MLRERVSKKTTWTNRFTVVTTYFSMKERREVGLTVPLVYSNLGKVEFLLPERPRTFTVELRWNKGSSGSEIYCTKKREGDIIYSNNFLNYQRYLCGRVNKN